MRPAFKRSRQVSLVLMGSLALAGCGDSATQRDIYASREDCAVDWGAAPQKCEPVRDQRTGMWHYYGPSYLYGNRGSAVGGTSHAVGSAVSRGGFGSTGSAHSGGLLIREPVTPRANWREQCESLGFSFHSMDGVYWDERACYAFSADEIDILEAATEELHRLCLQAVEHVVSKKRWTEFAIPPEFADYIEASWRRRDKSLFGRFDIAWSGMDGGTPPKMLEYNADTPTALLEASVVQWYWLQDMYPDRDQFNSIHEKLIDRWKEMGAELAPDEAVYFSCIKDNEEDLGNLEYMRDVATQAGIDARHLYIEDLGWDQIAGRFVDNQGTTVTTWFKLYPWEWLVREQFGVHLTQAGIRPIEPPWKMLLSNKAILPVLWELFPDHPNLLPAFFSPDKLGHDFVKKPKLSREGANVLMRTPDKVMFEPGGYGAEGFVYQGLATIPCFDGNYTVIGSWIVGDAAAGIGMRDDDTPITRNTSRFVPHYFV